MLECGGSRIEQEYTSSTYDSLEIKKWLYIYKYIHEKNVVFDMELWNTTVISTCTDIFCASLN